ncbi:site-specific integrase [Thalassotalea fonticola]|uniref:Site-specific integrase n=1 Tax=Thalassotalea fonticola TaxID=3065649 RepID=A0ABZ0GUN3_9GAMM|nr:site-specific integrase [Colwelliaceae bacterium S1-1]
MTKRLKITNSSIKALQVEDGRVNDTELSGFHARISPKGRITYYLFYRIKGKQVNFKIGTHPEITPTQARDLAKIKLGEVAHGIDVQEVKKEAKRQTIIAKQAKLNSYLEQRYLPWLETRNPKTSDKIIKEIKRAFPNYLEKQLSQIHAWDIEKWRIEKKKSGMSLSTINGYVNTLKGALSRAVEWNIIESHDLNKVKSFKVDNAVVRYLTDVEEKALRDALKERDKRIKVERENGNLFRQQRHYPLLPELRNFNYCDYLEPLVLLAMNTGMRRGELLSLEWMNVDLEQKYLTVIAGNSKSGKGRHIPLNNEALVALNNWQFDTTNQGYVFNGAEGKPLTDIKKPWSNLLKQAEINDFRFHDLRHHFASKLVMAGVDLNTVRELMGHSDLKMTLRYAHLAPEHKAAAVNLIG